MSCMNILVCLQIEVSIIYNITLHSNTTTNDDNMHRLGSSRKNQKFQNSGLHHEIYPLAFLFLDWKLFVVFCSKAENFFHATTNINKKRLLLKVTIYGVSYMTILTLNGNRLLLFTWFLHLTTCFLVKKVIV